MNWINLFHIYQPPGQRPEIFKKVTEESYFLIIKLLKKYPRLKITLNISGSLLEQLGREHRFIKELISLIKAEKIELTGTAKYHPILPLLPAAEIIRQIKLNDQTAKKFFGRLYRPKGFFLPEMAYSRPVGKIIRTAGFDWLALDEIHLRKKTVRPEIGYLINGLDLKAVFRNRQYSKSFPPEKIIKNFNRLKQEKFLVTAHDGELYGHHHRNWRVFSDKIFQSPKINFLTVSEYLKKLTLIEKISPRPASWESQPKELSRKNPYALWNNPDNFIQKELWRLDRLALAAIEKNSGDPNHCQARQRLDRAQASCGWWWASEKKPSAFSNIAWNPEQIKKNAQEMIEAVRTIQTVPKKTKLRAEKIYFQLMKKVWTHHWKYYG